MIRRVVIIGPESTGKSTLCQYLSEVYDSLWCPEFARAYLTKNGTDYTYENLLEIAKGQLTQEDSYYHKMEQKSKKDSFLFIDTDMYVMKVWSEYVFNRCDPFILKQIAERKYDFYLLCNTDLPWTKDEMREYPDQKPRQEQFLIYKDLMIHQNIPWTEVSGSGEDRWKNARIAMEKRFCK